MHLNRAATMAMLLCVTPTTSMMVTPSRCLRATRYNTPPMSAASVLLGPPGCMPAARAFIVGKDMGEALEGGAGSNEVDC